jgi:hypothetical protein
MLSNVEAGVNLEREKTRACVMKIYDIRGNENVLRNVNISQNQPQNLRYLLMFPLLSCRLPARRLPADFPDFTILASCS